MKKKICRKCWSSVVFLNNFSLNIAFLVNQRFQHEFFCEIHLAWRLCESWGSIQSGSGLFIIFYNVMLGTTLMHAEQCLSSSRVVFIPTSQQRAKPLKFRSLTVKARYYQILQCVILCAFAWLDFFKFKQHVFTWGR